MIGRIQERIGLRNVSGLMSLFVFAAGSMIGCSSAKPECIISGEVLVNNRRVDGVYVTLHKIDDDSNPKTAVSAAARTDESGSFSSELLEPGTYAVTAFWPAISVEEEQTIEGQDRFKGRYRDLKKPVASIEVEAGETFIPPVKLSLP